MFQGEDNQNYHVGKGINNHALFMSLRLSKAEEEKVLIILYKCIYIYIYISLKFTTSYAHYS